MAKKNSVDLFEGVVSTKGPKSNSLFMSQLESDKMKDNEKLSLSPVDFFCQHHDIVDKVSSFLSDKYPTELMKLESRKKIEVEAYNDVVRILSENKLLPQQKLVSKYIEIIFADILGNGILEPMMNDASIDEILVQSHDFIIVERGGRLEKSEYRFPSVENAKKHVDNIITPLNKRLNISKPNVNAQLPDGSRLSASVAPLRANGEISISIRKFSEKVHPLIFYSEHFQSSTPEMVQFLDAAVKAKLSAIVSGGTGSGKTTLLNSLSMSIPSNERIITAEDTLELKLQQPFVEAYQTIEENMEGKGAYAMQQLIIDTLRKRPDRIIVGECRGAEIVEMINAMNTGHEGSYSTIHANNTRDMISRATTMILSNESTRNLKETAILQMLDSALNLVIQTNRLNDGTRKITAITEIVGFGDAGFKILKEKGILKPDAKVNREQLYMMDIFRFREDTTDANGKIHGRFEATGYVPKCLTKIQQHGIQMDASFFTKRTMMEV